MINRLVDQQCFISLLSPPLKISCRFDTSHIDHSSRSFHLAAITLFYFVIHLGNSKLPVWSICKQIRQKKNIVEYVFCKIVGTFRMSSMRYHAHSFFLIKEDIFSIGFLVPATYPLLCTLLCSTGMYFVFQPSQRFTVSKENITLRQEGWSFWTFVENILMCADAFGMFKENLLK